MKYKLKIKLIIIADLLLAIFALYNSYLIYQKATIPHSKDLSNEIVFTSSNEIFSKATIVKINNSFIRNKEELEFACDQLSTGDNVLVSLRRGNDITQKNLRLVPYYSEFYIFIMLFVGFAFFFTGVFLLIKNQKLKFAYIFHWFAIAAACMIMLDFGKIFPNNLLMNIFLRLLYDSASAFTPLLFMHFSLLYPKETFPKFTKIIKYPYFIALILLTVIGYYHYELLTSFSIHLFQHYNILHTFHLKYLMLPAIIFVVINYTNIYFNTLEEEVKRRLKWIFLGILSGPAVYLFIYELPKWIFKFSLIDESLMIAFLIFAPISFFISIYKYRVIDVNIIINKGLVLTIILFVYSCIFLLLAYLLTPQINSIMHNILGNSINKDKVSQISLIILSIFAIFVFEPFKNLIQNYIDKQFFRTKYNYKEVLNKFLGKVKDMPSNQELIALLVQSINQSIPVTAFAIIWRDHDLQLIKSEQINFEPEELNEIDMLIRNTGGQSFYSAINSTEEELDLPEISDELTNNGIKIIINSYQSPSQSGLTLLLGAKKSESRYSFEDLELLRTLLNSTGVALQKLLLQSELILKEAEAQKLKEISELKSYFVSSVSHELKTPLTAIKLYAEFLNSNENLSEEKKKKYLAVIEGECNRLDRLINNVLGFSKIERGAKTYKFQNLDLRKIIDYIIDTFQYQLKMQNFELIFNADTEGVYPIYGDEDSLKEVFINLISNSIKYSLNEKLMILNLRNESDFIFFSIEDKGIGIRQDEIENIFAPFYRSKEMNVSNLGGAGLGLAIVKTILDAHSATVEIESQLNKGTIFIIKFPKDYENQNINS